MPEVVKTHIEPIGAIRLGLLDSIIITHSVDSSFVPMQTTYTARSTEVLSDGTLVLRLHPQGTWEGEETVYAEEAVRARLIARLRDYFGHNP